jgi:peptidoglycan hydrolase-like protein with peptidoglycan-binding domain
VLAIVAVAAAVTGKRGTAIGDASPGEVPDEPPDDLIGTREPIEDPIPDALPFPGADTERPSIVVNPGGKPPVGIGSSGEFVRAVQSFLEWSGFSVGPQGVDGRYGEATASAAVAWQVLAGITPAGNRGWGPKSWAMYDRLVWDVGNGTVAPGSV